LFHAWPGENLFARAKIGDPALREALMAEVRRRSSGAAPPAALAEIDVSALAKRKVEPMVRGLFAAREQAAVLAVLQRSVVFLTPTNIERVLGRVSWLETAWELANLYLASTGAKLLARDAPRIVGLSEETTC
jgi:hypothetical protein